MNHSFYISKTNMEYTARAIGSKVIAWQALTPHEDLIKTYEKRLLKKISKLIRNAN